MSNLTVSEILFQKFCDKKSIHWRRIPEHNDEKRPDYFVLVNDQLIVVEIKQFDQNEREKKIWEEIKQGKVTSYFCNAAYRIREKIDTGRKQLKKFSKKPTLLLLFDNTGGLLGVDSNDILQGMYGDETFKYLVPHQTEFTPILTDIFLGSGQKLTKDRTTYISGIASLIKPNFDNDYQIHIFHNKFTENPLEFSVASQLANKQFELEVNKNGTYSEWSEIKL